MRSSATPLCTGLLAVAMLAGACSSEEAVAPEPTPVVTSEASPEPTPTPTETEAGPTFTAEEQEVADAFPLGFDSDPAVVATAYAPDPELEGILVAAGEAAEARGDTTIGVDVTGVTIEGDVAKVAFNILINGAVVAPSNGHAVQVDGAWKVHVSTLCGLLSLAGPAPDGCANVEAPA